MSCLAAVLRRRLDLRERAGHCGEKHRGYHSCYRALDCCPTHDLTSNFLLRGGRPNGRTAPNIGHLFLLAVIRHAGPIRVDLHVAPRILLVTARPDIALVNGVLPRRVHRRVLLCIAWRCERGRGEYYGKHSQTLLQVNHEAFPSTVAWSAERTPIAQHIYPLRGDLAQSILLQSIGFCGNVECSRDPPLYCMAHPCCVCRVMEALKAKNCTATRTEIGWSLSD